MCLQRYNVLRDPSQYQVSSIFRQMPYHKYPLRIWEFLNKLYRADTTFWKAVVPTFLVQIIDTGQKMKDYIAKWEQVRVYLVKPEINIDLQKTPDINDKFFADQNDNAALHFTAHFA